MKNLLLVAAALLTGCIAPIPRTASLALGPPPAVRCQGVETCNFMWRRAQIWVTDNAGFKIQTATDSIISTYNAPAYSARWAFQVRRVPITKDTDSIELQASCGEVPLCSRRYQDVANSFVMFISQP